MLIMKMTVIFMKNNMNKINVNLIVPSILTMIFITKDRLNTHKSVFSNNIIYNSNNNYNNLNNSK